MVDPSSHNDQNQNHVASPDTIVVEPRKRSSGVVWLLLLLALAVLGWWWFSQRSTLGSTLPPMDGTASTGVPIGDGNALPAENADRAATRSTRKPSAAKPRQVAKATTPKMIAATPLNNPQPDYPRDAQRRGETGTVMLRVYVGADGSAGDVEFVQRSGSQLLDRAAQQAVARWTFRPAMRGGTAVASTVEVPVVFTLPAQ